MSDRRGFILVVIIWLVLISIALFVGFPRPPPIGEREECHIVFPRVGISSCDIRR